MNFRVLEHTEKSIKTITCVCFKDSDFKKMNRKTYPCHFQYRLSIFHDGLCMRYIELIIKAYVLKMTCSYFSVFKKYTCFQFEVVLFIAHPYFERKHKRDIVISAMWSSLVWAFKIFNHCWLLL